ncbi:glycosyltransferase [Luteibacter yeojuensis]|uniref:glycosyltransferase n=1 Tax=Luteibacter yeojuensis TaxID=345309 RepID=UPI0030840FAC
MLASTYPRWQHDHEPSFVHELSRRLTQWFEVVVICPHAAGAKRREVLDGVRVERYRYGWDGLETLVNDGGIVTNLRRAPWKWLLVPGFVAMQWLAARRELEGDVVVHAHWILTPGFVARMLRAPFVVTSHGADLFALRSKFPMALKRFVLKRARSMTVVSHAMLGEAAKLLDGSKIAVSPMGVDLRERFVPKVGALRESGKILFVGRLVEKKGVEVLLRAMPMVLARIPSATLTIVGFGPLEESLKSECAELGLGGVVTFVGAAPQINLVDYYRAASVFAAPFRAASSGDQEGLGLVLVEALGCGCPVVTSDIPAIRDVAAGMPGMRVVVPEDPRVLADGLVASLSEEMSDASKPDHAQLMERFDWDLVAARYARLLLSARLEETRK